MSAEQEIPRTSDILIIVSNLKQLRALVTPTVQNISKNKKWSETIINSFIIYLQQTENIKDFDQIKLEESPRYKDVTKLSSEYAEYLRDLRGLAEASIGHYCFFLKNFLDYKFGNSNLDFSTLTRKDCVEYMIHRTKSAPKSTDIPVNLRNILNFLFWAGYIDTNLGKNIPRQRVKRSGAIPRYISKDDIDRILNSVLDNPRRGKRDHAMLLLMAIAGLRAREVVRIKLEDNQCRLTYFYF